MILDRKTTVLLVIDMQNGYCDDKGGMVRKGMDIGPCKAIIPNIERLVSACRSSGISVVYTKQEHLPEDKEFVKKHYRLEPMKGTHLYGRLMGSPVPAKGTWDAEIIPQLAPEHDDLVVPKQKFSAFFGTNLDGYLKMKGVDTLLLTGVNSNVCIESTARDGYFREYTVIVVKDATAAPKQNEDLHLAAIGNVEKYLGWTVTTDEALRAVSPS